MKYLFCVMLAAVFLLTGCGPRPPYWVGGDPNTPLVSRAALDRMNAVLGMQESQRGAAIELHSGYTAQCLEASRKYREFMDAAAALLKQKSDDARITTRRDEATVKYARYADKLAEQFLDDLKLLLNDDQTGRWDGAMRALRRTQMLGSVYPEQSADLVAVCTAPASGLTAADMATIRPLLDDYELAIDVVLMRKLAFIRASLEKQLRAQRENDQAGESALSRQWRLIVRDERATGSRFARAISEALPEERRPALLRAVNRATYPVLYEDHELAQAVKKALEIEGLPEAASAKLKGIAREFERDRAALADDAAREFEKWELSAKDDELAEKGNTPEPSEKLIKAWMKLDEKVRAGIEEVLTPEQLEAAGIQKRVKELPTLEFE